VTQPTAPVRGGPSLGPRRSPPPALPVAEQALRVAPVAIVAAGVWLLAWRDYGSVDAGDWLPYALLASLVLASSLLAVRIRPLTRAAAAAIASLFALAALDALSIAWSPVPSLARDEALLVLFYATAFAVAAVTVKTAADRAYALGAIAAGAGGMAIATAIKLRVDAHPGELFYTGRLDFPVSYVNAQAAAMLVAFWPAVATAARRSSAVWIRALTTGFATALLCGWLLTQSKGGAVGLAVSVIVVLAVSPARLRLLVPALLAGALAAAGSVPLTAPIRTHTTRALDRAVAHGGTMLLVLTGVAVVLGAAYALLDRRVDVPRRVEHAAARAAAATLAAGLLALLGLLLASHPIGFVEAKWRSFKVLPMRETAGTHLLTLGSNRYDMWRVALSEFSHHPLLGIGSRGFGPAYLEHRRSIETPIRAHSLEMDTLAETGLAGIALLAAAFAFPLALAARRARFELSGAAALGTGVYFAAHSAVDWIWTFPVVGVLAFLAFGTAASSDERGGSPHRSRWTLGAAAAVLALGLVAFLPPWLASSYEDRAAEGGPGAAGDLRWARRLDPLSVDPYVIQSQLAATPAGAVAPLEKAVAKEPRAYELHYLLGLAYREAHRRSDARRELQVALRLDPEDPYVRQALNDVRKG
jgi:hypothetical protein